MMPIIERDHDNFIRQGKFDIRLFMNSVALNLKGNISLMNLSSNFLITSEDDLCITLHCRQIIRSFVLPSIFIQHLHVSIHNERANLISIGNFQKLFVCKLAKTLLMIIQIS